MTYIEHFKFQAKKLSKDWNNHTNEFFDVKIISKFFNIDPTIPKLKHEYALHYISRLAGYNKWTDLLKAPEEELELAKLVFENCKKNPNLIENWNMIYSLRFQNLDLQSKIKKAQDYFSNPETKIKFNQKVGTMEKTTNTTTNTKKKQPTEKEKSSIKQNYNGNHYPIFDSDMDNLYISEYAD